MNILAAKGILRSITEELQLLERMGNDDIKALEAFYGRSSTVIFRMLEVRLPSYEDAKNVLDATYTRIWQERRLLQEVKLLRTYTNIIAVKLCYEYYQDKYGSPFITPAGLDLLEYPGTDEDIRDNLIALYAALNAVSEQEQLQLLIAHGMNFN